MHQPSPETLFHFDDNLRKAFEKETQLFFESIMRENRSVLELLDADYTFLNERLARHYGIDGVRGERFRRVSLPAGSPRGGLLGQGSILMATSYPNRTSPVIRGKWILENVFGAPPPPAAAERARAERRARPAEGAADARAAGRAPRQSRVRGLPRADGSARVRAGELRRDRRMARHLHVGREGRRVGAAARRLEVQRAGGASKGADVAL